MPDAGLASGFLFVAPLLSIPMIISNTSRLLPCPYEDLSYFILPVKMETNLNLRNATVDSISVRSRKASLGSMRQSSAVWFSYCQEGTLGHRDHCFQADSARQNFTRRPFIRPHEFPCVCQGISRSSPLYFGIWKGGRRLEEYPIGVHVVGRSVVVSIVEGCRILDDLSNAKSSAFPGGEA
ncbi:uncharacterized protein HD556DRAFT_1321070 [Suillus plorans]|uniref:Uncharacterized protein n=1 Tax=Suillus plorans TaxID=116603 RepID=A0A9P7DY58_9AGAM|nr:uncharacterized protein HD556DRAFT_1321070 [Suillus plorans]KAG1806307.1 hypothetical protein HD556DRAFT_1321070 [Suillus plorans]